MESREGLNPISKAAPAFRVSASLFTSRQRGLTAVLVVTALLIAAGVKAHPAGGYKSRLLPMAADPAFNRGLSGGHRGSRGCSPGCVLGAEQPLLPGSSPSIHPSPGHTEIIAAASPRGNQGFSSSGGHVAVEWAGSVSSWALRLPCKAPSVRLCLRRAGQWEGTLEGK